MPIIKSAIKRVRSSEKRRKRNLITKDRYKELVKEFLKLIEGKKTAEAEKLFPQVQKAIDMATKKNLLQKNNAARKKSQLAKMMAGGGKTTAKKVAPAKKEEVKVEK